MSDDDLPIDADVPVEADLPTDAAPMMGFDAPASPFTHGGLDIPGLTLPASLTDPTAQPGTDPTSLPPGMFAPLPPEPHHAPSSLLDVVIDAVLHPTATPPPEDPNELERQRQERASQNATGQHTPMSPEKHF